MLELNVSNVRSTLETAQERLRVGVDNSRVGQAGRTGVRYVRHSWLYRWLTTEPEPDVIVIDLRETYTVGPFIRLLDRIIDQLVPALESSQSFELALRLEAAFRARPFRVVGIGTVAVVVLSLLVSAVLGRLGTVWLLGHAGLAVLSAVGIRSDLTLEDVTETRVWQQLEAAFEPPEPPRESRASGSVVDEAEKTEKPE